MSEVYQQFKERLRVKCVPHYTESEFDGLIDRVEKTAAQNPKKDSAPVDNTQIFVKQQCICGNSDSFYFVIDGKTGDTICMGVSGRGCGRIIQEHGMEEGAAFRKFEGEEDRNHYGPAANKLLPDSENFRTLLGGIGTHASETAETKKLKRTQLELEMNYSKVGNDERRTREGYKTQHKKSAFAEMEQLGDALKIHPQVVKRAQEEFSNYRDRRDAVQQSEGIVAACLAYAFRELARAGNNEAELLKRDFTFVPRKVEVQAAITDVAITSNAGLPMRDWTLQQVQDWLMSVAADESRDEASELARRVETATKGGNDGVALTSHGTTKRVYPLSGTLPLLGTTTVAGRKKKELALKGVQPKATAGQTLLRIYLEGNGCKNQLKDAIRRRLDFDTRKVGDTAAVDRTTGSLKSGSAAVVVKSEESRSVDGGSSSKSVEVKEEPAVDATRALKDGRPTSPADTLTLEGSGPPAKRSRFVIR